MNGLDHFLGSAEMAADGTISHKHALLDLIKCGVPFDNQQVQELGNSVIELKRFHYAMSEGRKMYHPQSGKGSQATDVGIHKVLSKTISSVIKARQVEDEADGYEKPNRAGYMPWMLEHNKEIKAKRKI